MAEEGVYFFFAKKIPLEDFKKEYAGWSIWLEEDLSAVESLREDFDQFGPGSDAEFDEEERLKVFKRSGFFTVCSKTQSVVSTQSVRSVFQFEEGMESSIEFTDLMKRLCKTYELLAVVDVWDDNGYWTGKSFVQSMYERFPDPVEEIVAARPVLNATDRLQEFLATQTKSAQTMLALKSAMDQLDSADKLHVRRVLKSSPDRQVPNDDDQISGRILEFLTKVFPKT